MPPKSEKQRRFFQAAAHNPAFAKKAGVPQSVAKEYVESDPGGKLPERKGSPIHDHPRSRGR